MLFFRSLLFNLAFFGWTALMLLLSLPGLLGPPRLTVRMQALWARYVLVVMRAVAGITVEVRGRAPAPPVIVAAKHQSAWDTLIWHLLFDDPAIVMKKELLALPIYGWMARKSGMIPVDRQGGRKALKAMLQAADRAARAGRHIVIFPEGTRTAPGSRVAYHPGVAALYRHLKLAVVPVAVNSGQFWPRRSFLKRPGRLVLEFLEPIEAGLERAAFMTELARRIEDGTDALVAETPAATGPVDNTPPHSGDHGDTLESRNKDNTLIGSS